MIGDEIKWLELGWKPSTRFVPPSELPKAILSGDPRLLPPTPRDIMLLMLYPIKGQKEEDNEYD